MLLWITLAKVQDIIFTIVKTHATIKPKNWKQELVSDIDIFSSHSFTQNYVPPQCLIRHTPPKQPKFIDTWQHQVPLQQVKRKFLIILPTKGLVLRGKWNGQKGQKKTARQSDKTVLHGQRSINSPWYTWNFSVFSKSNLHYSFNTSIVSQSVVTAEKSPLMPLDSRSKQQI